MAQKKYSLFNRLIQRFAASRLGAWYFAHTQHDVDRLFLWLSKGQLTLTSLLSGMPVLTLTSRGAKTGLTHIIPLLCIRDEANLNTIALVAANWGKARRPGWYYNLKANPRVSASIRGQAHDYVAHEAKSDEYAKYWQIAMQTYLGFAHYQRRLGASQPIPIMILTPLNESARVG